MAITVHNNTDVAMKDGMAHISGDKAQQCGSESPHWATAQHPMQSRLPPADAMKTSALGLHFIKHLGTPNNTHNVHNHRGCRDWVLRGVHKSFGSDQGALTIPITEKVAAIQV